jgi:hypothetical protein
VKALTFPTITLCNLNPFKKSGLDGTRFLTAPLQAKFDLTSSFDNFTYDDWSAVEDVIYSFPPNETEAETLCYSLEEFIAACTFQDTDCNMSDFKTIMNFEYCQ